ncbi:MAG TPA: type II secretion system protein [Bacilli bacterium]|nr:type II secretion system protein [Bacilli bacterium]
MRKKHGWTLLEMIVTIAVTSIFFTMVFSVISSLISNYKATERLNKADDEMSLLMQIFQSTVDSYNSEGYMINFVGEENKILELVVDLEEEQTVFEIDTEESKTRIIYQSASATSSQTLNLDYIETIVIEKHNSKLLLMKITAQNRTRQVVVMVVGGLEQ